MSELNLILLGPPGSGKGTQGERLQEDFDLPYYATGDILRAAVREGTEIGREAKGFMDRGDLVPDDVIVGVIAERIDEKEAEDGFILDGFPRNLAQADSLNGVLTELGQNVDVAVLMDVDFDILMKRLTGRRTCSKTGAVLNVYFSPPAELEACKKAGGELLQRADDNEATIRNRLQVYEKQTAPLIDYYEKRGLLKKVAATGEVDDVYGRFKKAVGLK